MIDLNHKYALLEDGTIEPLWYSNGEPRDAYRDEDGYFYLDHDHVIEYEGAFLFALRHDKIIATSDEERSPNCYRTYKEE